MTREEAKTLLPIIQAFAEGKTIQYETREGCIDLDTLNPHSAILSKYRIKSEPKYRPFKTQEECWNEMMKHQPFGWVKSKNSGSLFAISLVLWDKDFNDVFVTFGCGESHSSKSVLNEFTFADGAPFGIEE